LALDPSDEELLAAFLRGDRHSFETLIRRHEDRVFAVCSRMLPERSDALEASQEAFIAAFRRAASFRGDAAFSTWLHRIAINACHDVLRRRKPDAVPDEVLSGVPDRSTPVSETVALRMDLARALSELPEEYREAVLMHDVSGIPYDQIAAITKAPVGTVKSRISRGRRMLAGLLEPAARAEASKEET
jgi:RNA polymerase sigma-70 factor (ECF subfamily)